MLCARGYPRVLALARSAAIYSLILPFAVSAGAQSALLKEDTQAAKSAAEYPDEPYIFEYVRGFMRYENDGTGTREVRARIRVQSPAGLTTAGQLIFDYNAANEKMDIRSVVVTKQDGTVIKAGPDAVQDLSAPVAREAPMYTDARQKHVTVPGVAVGDSVEYDVVTTTVQPLMAGQFWQTWNFTDKAICLDEQLDLSVPRERAIKLKGPPDLKPAIKEEGDRRIYHWSTSNLQRPEAGNPFKDFKFDVTSLLQGPRQPRGRELMFSTFQSWEEVGKWYAQLEHERRVVTPEIRARAEMIVQGKTTDLAKTQALYEWVSRNIRYVSLSFGVGRYQPHAAGEVLNNRYGDCKDKATLLEALLEAEGLHAQAVLINAMADVDPDLPTPLQFNHAITMVKVEGEDRWLDSTLAVGPFAYLLPQLRGKNALVVFTDSAPALKKTPTQLAMTTLYGLEFNAEVNNEGKMDGTLSLETRGDLEVFARLTILNLPPGQLDAILQMATARAKATKDNKFDFSVSDFKNNDPTDTSKPFRMALHISGNLSPDDLKQLQSRDHAESSTQDFVHGLTSAASADKDFLARVLPQTAAELSGSREYTLKITIKVPSTKDETTNQPVGVHITRDFADYQATTSREGDTLHAQWRLAISSPKLKPGHDEEYASFRKQVMESMAEMAPKAAAAKTPEKGSLTTTVLPPAKKPLRAGSTSERESLTKPLSPTANALYSKALAAIKSQNWGNAEQDLESVVKQAPDWDTAWSNLGRTRMALRKFPEAETAFRRYLGLSPDFPLAYEQLATALMAQEKFGEAAKTLEEDLVNNPKNTASLRQLGFIYLRLHEPERAVNDLETAAGLAPQNAYGQFLLGWAYLDSHQVQKGAAALERAVFLDGSDSTLNNAAYRLSEAKTHLDQAESWSVRSIAVVEIELNHTALESIQPKTASLLTKASMYWDTFGWIKFQKNDLPAAEKYIRAAWELADDTTIGIHLGRVYLAQGQKERAVDTLAQALATAPSTRPATDDENEARKQLGVLLNDSALVDVRINQAKPKARERRSIQVANSAKAEGIAQYMVIVGPGSKVTDLQAMTPDNQLDGMTDALRAATLPQSFPDDNITQIPGTAVLACAKTDQPCRLSLLSVGVASRVFPAAQTATDATNQ